MYTKYVLTPSCWLPTPQQRLQVYPPHPPLPHQPKEVPRSNLPHLRPHPQLKPNNNPINPPLLPTSNTTPPTNQKQPQEAADTARLPQSPPQRHGVAQAQPVPLRAVQRVKLDISTGEQGGIAHADAHRAVPLRLRQHQQQQQHKQHRQPCEAVAIPKGRDG